MNAETRQALVGEGVVRPESERYEIACAVRGMVTAVRMHVRQHGCGEQHDELCDQMLQGRKQLGNMFVAGDPSVSYAGRMARLDARVALTQAYVNLLFCEVGSLVINLRVAEKQLDILVAELRP